MVVAVYRGTNLQSSRAQEIRVLEFEKNIRVEFEWVAPVGKDEPKIREYLFVRIPKSSKPIEIVEYERGPSAVKRRVFAEIK
jgi:hypothetical protein